MPQRGVAFFIAFIPQVFKSILMFCFPQSKVLILVPNSPDSLTHYQHITLLCMPFRAESQPCEYSRLTFNLALRIQTATRQLIISCHTHQSRMSLDIVIMACAARTLAIIPLTCLLLVAWSGTATYRSK